MAPHASGPSSRGSLPHLYTGAAAAQREGGDTTLARPLYHEWPALEAAYEHASHWLLGEGTGIVAAPVTAQMGADGPLAADRPLWVPPGAWVQRHTGLLLNGPRRLRQSLALDEVPPPHARGRGPALALALAPSLTLSLTQPSSPPQA